jgi:hypothetical protein
MRNIIILLFFPVFLSAQTVIIKDSFPTYQGVVNIENKSANEINALVKSWIAINYKSANDVIQMDQKDKIIIKAKDKFSYDTEFVVMFKKTTIVSYCDLFYNIIFDIKDGKFRYTINYTDFKINNISGDINQLTQSNKPYEKFYKLSIKSNNDLINRINEIKNQTSTPKDNW